ncbi:hypothetical protein BGZ72_009100 [Mortierella alpina]|nr:hypothetical protein BGZ72_009100 [Mortierella alpina]
MSNMNIPFTILAVAVAGVSRLFRPQGKGFKMSATVAILAAAAVAMTPALAELPLPINATTARSYLAALRVEPENNNPAYNRSMFRHWVTISSRCDTRETVLKRDGTDVLTNSFCTATSGTWRSPYDGATWTQSSHMDIDHVVPLKEAWVSGARLWTAEQRQAFANDLTRPQLLAVTDRVNQAKGDKDPAEWMPPLTSFHCTYLQAYVQVKHYYNLTVDSLEMSAISSNLEIC